MVSGRRRGRGIAAALLAGAVIIELCYALDLRGVTGPVELAWQLFAFQFRQWAGAAPAAAPRAPLVLVYYDASSQAAYSQSGTLVSVPPRRAVAVLVARLRAAGARAIVLDYLYHAPSDAATDGALAAALRHAGNVVIAQTYVSGCAGYICTEQLIGPLPALAAAARLGDANIPPAAGNGCVLSAYTAFHGTPTLPAAAAALTGVRGTGTHSGAGTGTGAGTATGAAFAINFPAAGAFPAYSFARVADGSQPLGALAGAVALVGQSATLAAPSDLVRVPRDGDCTQVAGLEFQAAALNTLLRGDALASPAPAWRALWVAAGALLAVLVALRFGLALTALCTLLLEAAQLALALALFLGAGVWLPVAAPALATALAPFGVLGVRLGYQQRDNRALRAVFARFVAPAVARRIADRPDAVGLEGERREISVLFADIDGFTPLSEGLEPDRVVALLRLYFTAMVECIQAEGGAIDKFIGDAIMALFGAPEAQADAPARAMRAALAMQRRVRELQPALAALAGRPLEIGIGLHHGTAYVGIMGTPARQEYSAIGDTVNVAARLVSETKKRGYDIIVGDALWAALPPDLAATIEADDLGAVSVKGRATPVPVRGVRC